MPEGYTHVRMAAQAASLAKVPLTSVRAYALGANGPDPFFFYQVWLPAKYRTPDLAAFGGRMHREKTGAFLKSLLLHAKTKAQWDYALGFLCHYGLDSVMHPYVAAVQQPGQPYCQPAGHGFFEIGLDSYLYQRDYTPGGIPAQASTPKIPMGMQLQIAGLLQICIREVYGKKIPLEAIRKSFDHMRLVRAALKDPCPVVRGAITLAELAVGRGYIFSHVTPTPLKGIKTYPRLPKDWTNPYTGETVEGDLFDCLAEGVDRSALLVRAAQVWKEGEITWEQLCRVIGDRSYETGLEGT